MVNKKCKWITLNKKMMIVFHRLALVAKMGEHQIRLKSGYSPECEEIVSYDSEEERDKDFMRLLNRANLDSIEEKELG